MPGTSLETELREARVARGLSLDDIQAETRIPVHILKQFEDGRLVGDETYSEVYLRAFLKAYAKSVGLSQSDVIARYDASRGRDRAPAPPARSTSPETREDSPPPAPSSPPPAAASAGAASAGVAPAGKAPSEAEPSPAAPARPPAVTAASRERGSTAGAISGARVKRPPVPSARRSFDKNWGMIIGLFVVVVAVLGAAVWFLLFRDADEPEGTVGVVEQSGGEVTAIDSVGVGTGSGTNAPQLQVPITVTLYAGGDGLQNFRVTAEPEERLGHWIEAGDSKTFTSPQAILLWGEGGDGFGDDAVVELQGQRWTPSGAAPLRIDAASGQRLLDSLSTRPPGSIPAVPGEPAVAE